MDTKADSTQRWKVYSFQKAAALLSTEPTQARDTNVNTRLEPQAIYAVGQELCACVDTQRCKLSRYKITNSDQPIKNDGKISAYAELFVVNSFSLLIDSIKSPAIDVNLITFNGRRTDRIGGTKGLRLLKLITRPLPSSCLFAFNIVRKRHDLYAYSLLFCFTLIAPVT